MSKFIGYFYIFSKLLTSIVLLMVITLMGYLLFRSYQDVDQVNNEFKSEIDELTNSINKNTISLDTIQNKININNQSIVDLNNSLTSNKEKEIDMLAMKEQVDALFFQYKELEKILIEKKINLNENIKQKNEFSKNTNQVNSIIELILIKFSNGEEISKELSFLEKNVLNKKQNFEKIYFLETKKFYGLEKLNKLFDEQSEIFIKKTYLKNNQNSIIAFLSQFVFIKPANLSNYENDNLNILLRASQYMRSKELDKSLNQIKKIENNEIFFDKWINQVEIYLNFKSEIERIKIVE